VRCSHLRQRAARCRTVFNEEGTRGGQNLIGSFEAEDERYAWLNDLVCIAEGMILIDPYRMRDPRLSRPAGEEDVTAIGTHDDGGRPIHMDWRAANGCPVETEASIPAGGGGNEARFGISTEHP
jgi:hypothetical protein